MDLRIEIRDENLDILKYIEIYQDGSDSEGAEKISELIKSEYESTAELQHTPW